MGPDGTDSPTAAALVFEGVTLVAGGVASLTGTISLDGLSLDLGAVVHPDPEGDGVPNAEAVTQLNAAARAAGFGWPHDPFLDDGDDLLFRGPLPAADATTADLAAATPAYAPATGAPPVTVSTVPALPPDSPAAGSLVLLGAAAGGQLGRLTGTVSVGGRGLDLGRVRLVDTTGDQVVSTAEALAQLGAAAQAAGLTSGDSFTVVGEDVVFRGPVPADDATAEEVAAASPVYRPATGAPAAIRAVDRAIGLVSAQRAELGAVQNRLEHTIGRLGVALENATAAESRIRDTDMAQEMTRFARGQVLIQAGTAMLAQANQSAQRVLSLLQP
nr:flagellin [Modestobacter marinus]